MSSPPRKCAKVIETTDDVPKDVPKDEGSEPLYAYVDLDELLAGSDCENSANEDILLSTDDEELAGPTTTDGHPMTTDSNSDGTTTLESTDTPITGSFDGESFDDSDVPVSPVGEWEQGLYGLSQFEIKYGTSPRRVVCFSPVGDGSYKEVYKSSSEMAEIDKVRVAKALGTVVDLVLPTMMSDRMNLKNKKFVLIDLSGTLHVEDSTTDRAVMALLTLRCNGYHVLFVTNTTKESKKKLHSRLVGLGFDIKISELFTSLDATRNHLVENSLRPMLLVSEEAMEDFDGIDLKDPNCVVIGLSPQDFNRETLSKAARLVMTTNAKIVAVHKGRHYRSASGMNMGPGCFTVALEMTTGKVADVLGKPEEKFYQAALKYIGCNDPLEAIMIGDDVHDDVYGAMRAGMTGILVKTGKYMAGDERKIYPLKPDYVCDNFFSAVDRLITMKKYSI